MPLYVGLMSGTSLDGLDGVLVDLDGRTPKVLGHVHRPFAPALRAELLALNTPGPDELHRAALAANALVRLEAECVQALLAEAGVPPTAVTAVGAHGQTVRHRPGEFDGTGYTVQLHNGALLAELCGIDVVCDFRSRDIAAGGQGAPLVPAFHAAVFAQPEQALAVLNLGGIANLTLVGKDGSVRGFDCGPANSLLDGWCERHTGHAYDDQGRWGAGGRVLTPLLQALMGEPFLQQPPPKSTGRDLFNLAWLQPLVARHAAHASPQDVQATLAEFSAAAVANELHRHAPHCPELVVCGGGVFNTDLMARLGARLPGVTLRSSAERGVPPTQVEAVAFAWLAQAFTERRPGNLVAVTGARGPRVLGALYPAR
jgi:anhydro-N-acetylmuramic acid kinase